jgi:hypothetical protein
MGDITKRMRRRSLTYRELKRDQSSFFVDETPLVTWTRPILKQLHVFIVDLVGECIAVKIPDMVGMFDAQVELAHAFIWPRKPD